MADYTAAESARLALCLPELRDAEARFRAACEAAGITYVIPEDGAFRSAVFQAALVKIRDAAVAAGAASYRVAPVGHSYHEAGAAFDIRLTNPPSSSDDPDDPDPRYALAADIGEGVGLTPGFKFSPPPDIFHFQLPVDLATAQAEYANLTTKRVAVGGIALGLAVLVGVALTGRS